MTTSKRSTIDWDKHWEAEDEPEGARQFAVKMAYMLKEFIKTKKIKCIADYGCGPGTMLFTLAKSFPQITFHGYDIAASIIQKNNEKSQKNQLKSLFFERDSLPYPKTKKKLI